MTYHYYGVKGDSAWKLAWHNSWLLVTNTNSQHMPRLVRESDQVWVQGSRGGVQLIKVKDYFWNQWPQYIKHDSEEMKQFMWAKLRAKSLNIAL